MAELIWTDEPTDGQPYDAIVYEKKPPLNAQSGRHGVPRNIAGEASAFLKFIVDYYDALPLVMVFLHGHRLAYHQEDIALLLAQLPDFNLNSTSTILQGEEAYCNLNRVVWGHKEDPGLVWLRHSWDGPPSPSSSCAMSHLALPSGCGPGGWMKPWLGPLEGKGGKQDGGGRQDGRGGGGHGGGGGSGGGENGSLPSGGGAPPLLERCCAQFLVGRSRIRRRPRSFYEAALEQMAKHVDDDDAQAGRTSRKWGLLMEWSWHVIFGAPKSLHLEDAALQAVLAATATAAVKDAQAAASAAGLWSADRIMVDRPVCVVQRRAWK